MRRLCTAVLCAAFLLVLPAVSHAFLGFGERTEASGLDLREGYDVNTVVLVTGRVTSLPQSTGQGNVLIEMKSGEGTVYLSVGPEKFWEKGGVKVGVNDEVAAKGSRAQGKDGKVYLLTQKLTNRTTGAQLEMRDAQGTPLWSSRPTSRTDGPLRRDGGALRGSDMMRDMMRGGGAIRGGGMMGGGMRR